MMPLHNILRKCTEANKFTEFPEKFNHIMFTNDIKLFVKYEKEMKALIQTIRIYSQD